MFGGGNKGGTAALPLGVRPASRRAPLHRGAPRRWRPTFRLRFHLKRSKLPGAPFRAQPPSISNSGTRPARRSMPSPASSMAGTTVNPSPKTNKNSPTRNARDANMGPALRMAHASPPATRSRSSGRAGSRRFSVHRRPRPDGGAAGAPPNHPPRRSRPAPCRPQIPGNGAPW